MPLLLKTYIYEDGSEELYDMFKDPNEWTNLAGNPEYRGIITRFKAALPKNQAPNSKVSSYNVNDHWKAEARANKNKK